MTLRLWFQSTGQLEALYGREGKRSWYASAAYRVYAGIADEETAKEAAALFGGYTARPERRHEPQPVRPGRHGGQRHARRDAERERCPPRELPPVE